ncbi:MAG: glycosidase, partial [Sphingobacteriaceae bacterium]
MIKNFAEQLQQLKDKHEQLLNKPNVKANQSNGIYHRYQNPVLTAAHAPL